MDAELLHCVVQAAVAASASLADNATLQAFLKLGHEQATPDVLEACLHTLADALCDASLQEPVATSCRCVLQPIVARLLNRQHDGVQTLHVFCVVAQLVAAFPQTHEPFLQWLQEHRTLFQHLAACDMDMTRRVVHCIADVLLAIGNPCYHAADWTDVFALLHHSDADLRLAASVAAGRLVCMDLVEAAQVQDAVPAWVSSRMTAEAQRARLIEADARMRAPDVIHAAPQLGVVVIGGVVAPIRPCTAPVDVKPLVHTPVCCRNLGNLAAAYLSALPVLVEGPPGCGKSAVVAELGRLTGNQDLIELHLDDSMDSKTLIGTYVCTDVPGEFKWQPGPLTQAVRDGRWIFVEDIDRAPFELLSALVSLLDSRKLVIEGTGEAMDAAPGFRLFASRTTRHGHGISDAADITAADEADALEPLSGSLSCFASYWARVRVWPLPLPQLSQVVAQRHPQLPTDILADMLSTLRLLLAAARGEQTPGVPLSDEALHAVRSLVRGGRSISQRDLLKWASRVATLDCIGQRASGFVTHEERTTILLEALDVFCGHLPTVALRVAVGNVIAQLWGLHSGEAAQLLTTRKPDVAVPFDNAIKFGRVELPVAPLPVGQRPGLPRHFAQTRHALCLCEQLSACVVMNEPCLLVGETGNGKTSVIQALAQSVGATLVVQNLNVQSDSADLLGGFRPVQQRQVAVQLYKRFNDMFGKLFSKKANADFLRALEASLSTHGWRTFVDGIVNTVHRAQAKLASEPSKWPASAAAQWAALHQDAQRFDKQVSDVNRPFAFAFVEGLLVEAVRKGHWILLDEINLASPEVLQRLSGLLDGAVGGLALTERGDVEAVPRHPNFRLFAAMNPPTDVGKKDLPPALRARFTELFVDLVTDEADLRLVAAAYLEGIESPPITELVTFYSKARAMTVTELVDGTGHKPQYSLRTLCRALRYARHAVAQHHRLAAALYDGLAMSFVTQLDKDSEHKLTQVIKAMGWAPAALPARQGGSVATKRLTREQEQFVVVENFRLQVGSLEPADPSVAAPDGTIKFVLTDSVRRHLRNLARAVACGLHPVLLQGPTSAGKTSLVEFLGARTGHVCVRINNHEHTDLQEYIGSYVTGTDGRLVFQEGALVQAVRQGHWLILDELNLAPSEVLEALNRLLDDNRELFIPETMEVVKPHPQFMLFATQNPAGVYGGRKALSQAFKNRFLEMHVDDIPSGELVDILQQRCGMAPSHASYMVKVMQSLQQQRQVSAVFAGKHGFVTPRDLLRWANRKPTGYKDLAEDGFMLLGERLRRDDEALIVKKALSEHLNKTWNASWNVEALYAGLDSEAAAAKRKLDTHTSARSSGKRARITSAGAAQDMSDGSESPLPATLWDWDTVLSRLHNFAGSSETLHSTAAAGVTHVTLTSSLRRLFVLVWRCLANQEPVLLVGDTGCGKTTICQLFAALLNKELHIVNCHQHSETADFLGGLRPARGKDAALSALRQHITTFMQACVAHLAFPVPPSCSVVDGQVALDASLSVAAMMDVYQSAAASAQPALSGLDDAAQQAFATTMSAVETAYASFQALFSWQDGPLVTAMKQGDFFLLDELSLAEDAVLERLNSVLEPSRTLFLAERGGDSACSVVAAPDFRILATMNPGGDFGKRELSPALRNRFTEIWVPPITDMTDLRCIIEERILLDMPRGHTAVMNMCSFAPIMLQFVHWFNSVASGHLTTHSLQLAVQKFDATVFPTVVNTARNAAGAPDGAAAAGPAAGANTPQSVAVTLRDVLSWVSFMCTGVVTGGLPVWHSYLHGAALVLLDGVGLGTGLSETACRDLRTAAYHVLAKQLPTDLAPTLAPVVTALANPNNFDGTTRPDVSDSTFGIAPFYIPKGPHSLPTQLPYALHAPTTCSNLVRVLRALQLSRPILLEGSPGVGKTSLISALAAASGHRLVRINLSEQTDVADLLGSDLPVGSDSEAGKSGARFAWCDGVFLQALKAGDWVLLDELNLASQAVLEGLNACLDHRATVYIPEIDKTFACPPTFRVFAAQNPVAQGGGRKGLPRSFLNRFTKVHVSALSSTDLLFIAQTMFPSLAATPGLGATPSVSLLEQMIRFNDAIVADTMDKKVIGRLGQPWEFNLRDLFRWCELLLPGKQSHQHALGVLDAARLVYSHRFRTWDDRQHLANTFIRVFGQAPDIHHAPMIVFTPSAVAVGHAIVTRNHHEVPDSMTTSALPKQLLPIMESVALCVGRGWPCLLVGGASTGKTHVLRLLASLARKRVREISLSASTDSSELLGCFEQVDIARRVRNVVATLLSAIGTHWRADIGRGHELRDTFRSAVSRVYSVAARHSFPTPDIVPALLESLTEFLTVAAGVGAAATPSQVALRDLLTDVHAQLGQCVGDAADQRSAMFEWVDGPLVQAIMSGEWVILNNANFANPTVLDRLNALMEPGGELLINECGLVNGSVRIVRPHADFRLFLVMDPQYGEVSRAMRNRCIELAIPDTVPDTLAIDVFSGTTRPVTLVQSRQQTTYDLLRLANESGVPGGCLPGVLAYVHQAAVAASPRGLHPPTPRQLSHLANLVSAQLTHGVELHQALQRSIQLAYGDIAVRIVLQPIAQVLEVMGKLNSVPGVWPPSGTSGDDDMPAAAAAAWRNVALLQALACWLHPIAAPSSVLPGATTAGFQLSLGPSAPAVSSVQQQFVYAVKLYAEQASLADASARCQVLAALASWLGDSATGVVPVLHSARRAIMHVAGHRLNGLVTKCSAHLPASDQELVQHSSMSGAVRGHQAVADLTTQAAYLSGAHSLMQLLWKCMWQREEEKSCSSATIASAVFNDGRFPRNLASLRQLGVVVGALDAWIDELFEHLASCEPAYASMIATALGSSLAAVLEARAQVLRVCLVEAAAFDRSAFQVQWLTFVKRITAAEALWLQHRGDAVAVSQRAADLMAALHRRDVAWSGDVFPPADRPRRSALWKYGGHPSCPRTVPMVDALSQVTAFMDSLNWSGREPFAFANLLRDQHASLFVSVDTKQELLQVLETLHWIDVQTDTAAISKIPSVLAVATAALEKDRAAIWSGGGAVSVKFAALQGEEGMDEAARDAAAVFPAFADSSLPLRRHWAVSTVRPIAELSGAHQLHQFIVQLSSVMPSILHLVGSSLLHKSSTAIVEWTAELQSTHAACVRILSAVSGAIPSLLDNRLAWSVAAIAPWQQLVWMCHNVQPNPSSAAAAAQDCVTFARAVLACEHRILCGWYDVLWNGSYADTAAQATPVSPPSISELETLGTVVQAAPSRDVNADVFAGPVSLAQPVFQWWAAKFLSNGDGTLLLDTPARITQLQELIRYVTSCPVQSSTSSYIQQDMVMLCWRVYITFFCRRAAAGDELSPALASWLAQIQSLAHAGDGAPTAEVMQAALGALHGDSAAQAVVTAVGRLASCQDDAGRSQAVAQAWVAVGNMQAQMLAPLLVLDPAHKAAVKYQMTQDTIASVLLHIEVQQWSLRLATCSDSDAQVRMLRDVKQSAQDKAARLWSKLVIRPTATRFADMVAGVTQLGESFLGVKTQQLQADLLAATSPTARVFAEAAGWQRTTSEELVRLQTKFRGFEDILLPICAAVHAIKHGLNGLAQAAAHRVGFLAVANRFGHLSLAAVLVQLSTSVRAGMCLPRGGPSLHAPKDLLDSVLHLLQCPWPAAADTNLDPVMVLRAATAMCVSLVAVQPDSVAQVRQWVLRLSKQFWTVWDAAKTAAAEAKAAEDALYAFKTQSVDSETPEEREERLFLAMFPTYHEDFQDLVPNAPDAGDADAPKATAHGRNLLGAGDRIKDEDLALLFAIHDRVFNAADNGIIPSHVDVSRALEQGAFVGQQVLRAVATIHANISFDSGLEAGMLLAFERELGIVSGKSAGAVAAAAATDDEPSWDALHGPVPPKELEMMCTTVNTVLGRTVELLGQFPGNAVLSLIARVAERVLRAPRNSPFMKVLTGMELLLNKAQEWQAYAHSGVSMADELKTLGGMVTRWRQIELRAWKDLLNMTDRECRARARRWWFHLFGVVNPETADAMDKPQDDQPTLVPDNWLHVAASDLWACPGMTAASEAASQSIPEDLLTHLKQCFEAIDRFLRSCSIGEFPTRLDMIRAFADQLLQSHSKDRVRDLLLARLLHHMHAYFEQHAASINRVRANVRAPVEKDLSGQVKIAKWDEQTYYSLKQSAERSHRALHKLSLKYQQALTTGVSPILDTSGGASSVFFEADQLPPTEIPDEVPAWGLEAVKCAGVWDSMPSDAQAWLWNEEWTGPVRPARLPQLVSQASRLIAESVGSPAAQTARLTAAQVLDELAGNVITRSAALRADKSDGVMSLKKRALGDLMETLKQLGFTYSKSKCLPQQCEPFHVLLLPDVRGKVLSYVQHCSVAGVQAPWTSADSYFYRVVDHLHRLRQEVAGPRHEDLASFEVQRTHGLSEHLFHVILEQRLVLGSVCEDAEQLTRVDNLLALLQNPQSLVRHQAAGRTMIARCCSAVETSLTAVQELLVLCNTLVSSSRSGDVDVQAASRCVDTLSNLHSDLQACASNMGHALRGLAIQQDHIALCSQAQELLTAVAAGADGCAAVAPAGLTPAISAVGDRARAAAAACAAARSEVDVNAVSGDVPAALNAQLRRLLETCVLAIQDQHQVSWSMQTDSEEDAVPCVLKVHDQFVSSLRDLRIAKLHQVALDVFTAVVVLPDDARQAAAAVATEARALLAMVCQVQHRLIAEFVSLHRVWSKCLYVLVRTFRNLYTQGYCKPQESGDGEGGGGATKFEDDVEGTGMGEGEGKKDVSDELDNEEQLLGLQGEQPPEPQEKKKPDEQDKGVEMENDFDGELHDMEPDEQQDDDDNDDEDEKEEIDRQMGDVGDDEKVVDEKMWGSDSEDDDQDADEQEDTKMEQDAPMEGAPEEEIRGKEDSDEKDKKGKDKKEKPEEKPAGKPSEEDEKDMNEEDVDVADNEEDEGRGEDQYEDNHGVGLNEEKAAESEDEDEDMDLKPDMQLDKDEAGGSEGDGEEEDEAGEGEDDEQFEDPLARPETEDDAGSQGGKEDKPDDDAAEGEKSDEDEQPDVDTGAGGDAMGEAEPEQPDVDGTTRGAEESESESEEQADEEDDAAEGEQPADADGEADESQPPAAGVADKAGKDSVVNPATEESAGKDEEAGRDKKPQQSADPQADEKQDQRDQGGQQSQKQDTSSSGGADGSDWQRGAPSAPQPQPQQVHRNRSNAANVNPYADPNKALKHWEKRLQELQSDAADKPAEEKGGDEEGKTTAPDVSAAVDGDIDMLGPVQEDAQQVPRAEQDPDANKPDEAPEQPPAPDATPEEAKDTAAKDDQDKKQGRMVQSNTAPTAVLDENDEDTDMEEKAEPAAPTGLADGDVDMDDDDNAHIVTRVQEHSEHEELDAMDLAAMAHDLRAKFDDTFKSGLEDATAARDAWSTLVSLTSDGASRLCEALRLVLDPTQATKLQGDYRTGKRINMRKVIPYIASQFRKDKIWMRRTKPSKRQYQILLAIDDSESMAENRAGAVACEALATICKALTKLEVGELGVVRFGSQVEVLHPLDTPFNDEVGARVVSGFTFAQRGTQVVDALKSVIGLLSVAQERTMAAALSRTRCMQLVFFISDGKFPSGQRPEIARWVRAAANRGQLVVWIVVDSEKSSILTMNSVSFKAGKGGASVIEKKAFLEDYPFPYYLVIRNVAALPAALSDALRQWFELVQGSE